MDKPKWAQSVNLMEDFEFKRMRNLANCLAWRKSSKLRITRWIPEEFVENKYQNEENLKELVIKLISRMVWIKTYFLSEKEEEKR